MAAVKRRPLEVASRRVVQDARLAIRDVYDAIVELVTNADDRYQILRTEGRVEIELGRQGRGQPSIPRVRDFADGMTTEQMNRKLGRIGGRVSGLEEGHAVRGTNSRGAKDIAALGKVTFESIPGDGRVHTCRIFPNLEYEADDSRPVTKDVREGLGIGQGTGTVVTIEVDPTHRIPKIDTLVPKVATLVRLRDIVRQGKTKLVVKGLRNGARREVSLHPPAGRKRIYRWNRNVLEVGARHPSLKRYLGPKSERYPGQDALHFRVLLAEVVAEALCARRLQGNIEANPGDFEAMSWDDYYRHFSELMSRFLPKAHGLMAPGV